MGRSDKVIRTRRVQAQDITSEMRFETWLQQNFSVELPNEKHADNSPLTPMALTSKAQKIITTRH